MVLAPLKCQKCVTSNTVGEAKCEKNVKTASNRWLLVHALHGALHCQGDQIPPERGELITYSRRILDENNKDDFAALQQLDRAKTKQTFFGKQIVYTFV